MTLELICNDAILDEISTIDKFEIIKHNFFGELRLTKEWFYGKLKLSLENLGGRYDKDFNVDIPLQNHFEFIVESKKTIEIANEFIDSLKQDFNELDDLDEKIKDKITFLVNSLNIKSKYDVKGMFDWKIKFQEVEKTIKEEIEKMKDCLDGPKDRRKYTEYRKAYQIIETLNFEKYISEKFPFYAIKNKIIFLKGDAGSGKSHLMGFETDIHKEEHRIVLLLGQKLINDSKPWIQIKEQLDINCEQQIFLNALECKGAVDNSITTIMIDAINESAYHKIWKEYLNDLVSSVSKCKHIKLVCSVRTTYINAVFNDAIKEKIDNGEILVLKHHGFEDNSINAMNNFFIRHDIPTHIASHLPYEFSNPLLLKLFCETYDNDTDIDDLNYLSMFQKLVEKENAWIKDKLEITDCNNYVQDIIGLFIKIIMINCNTSVSRKQLELKLVGNQASTLSKMINGQILFSFYDKDSNEEFLYFRYEKMSDYFIAQNIIQKHKGLLRRVLLRRFVKAKLFICYDYRKIKEHKLFLPINKKAFITTGIASAIFSIVNEEEKGKFADFFLKLDEKKYLNAEEIIIEIIKSYSFMKTAFIKENLYRKILNAAFRKYNDRYSSNRIIKEHFNVLITNAGKMNNELNSNALTNYLMQMTLTQRDYLWTNYINHQYYEGHRIRYTVENIIKNDIVSLSQDEKFLLSQELCWFLTASNRKLRDKSSRALVKLLTNEIAIIDKLYDIFLDDNNPYIIQRLVGCIYGAILKSEINSTNTQYYICFVNKIYETIFNKEEVYPDVLLRDYTRNIIEYALHIGVSLQFDVNKCRPPYRSAPIPTVDSEKVKKEYETNDENSKRYNSALRKVKFSMQPDTKTEDGMSSGYGNFGRYTFQSALNYFKGVDIRNAYYYSLDYIKNILGYSNDFSEIDNSYLSHYRQVNDNSYLSYYRQVNDIERIGKKYQWITAYRIWALVCDNYEYDTHYGDGAENYSGPWEPYMRDFDPTLTLVNNERIYDIDDIEGRRFNVPNKFSEWELDNKNWIKRNDNIFDYEKYIKVDDDKDEEWICLFFTQSSRSDEEYENDYRSLWREAGAFFVEQKNYQNYINLLKDKNFYGRWFYHVGGAYTIFADEYVWSPAFNEQFSGDFELHEVKTEETVVKKVRKPKISRTDISLKLMDMEIIASKDEASLKDEFYKELEELLLMQKMLDNDDENAYEYVDEEQIVKADVYAKKAWINYNWEAEYDYSKNETIRYAMPCADIIKHFGLKQKENGIWYLDNEAVCIDFSLLKNTDSESLYIKKNLLNTFLKEKGYDIFWVGLGEKNDVKAPIMANNNGSISSNISIFMYRDNDWNIIKDGMLISNDYGKGNPIKYTDVN